MTKIEIVQKLHKWCGMAGAGPTTTVGQTGEYGLLVDWADDALRDVYNLHETWQFLRDDVQFNTVVGTADYTPTEAGAADLARWATDDVRCYLSSVSDEQEIYWAAWEEFKRTYRFGSARVQPGRPTQFSIKPDKSLALWPVPDNTYTYIGEYYKSGTTPLSTDASEPLFDARYHMIVVWRALIYYGADYIEFDRLAFAQNEYSRLKGDLEFDQLPAMGWGKPLA